MTVHRELRVCWYCIFIQSSAQPRLCRLFCRTTVWINGAWPSRPGSLPSSRHDDPCSVHMSLGHLDRSIAVCCWPTRGCGVRRVQSVPAGPSATAIIRRRHSRILSTASASERVRNGEHIVSDGNGRGSSLRPPDLVERLFPADPPRPEGPTRCRLQSSATDLAHRGVTMSPVFQEPATQRPFGCRRRAGRSTA